MMVISQEDVLEYITGLSVLEISELVKEFEEKFGVAAIPETIREAKTKKINIEPMYVKMNRNYKRRRR